MSNNDPIAVRLSASWEMDRPSSDVVSRVCKLNIVELLWLSSPTCHPLSPTSSSALNPSQSINSADYPECNVTLSNKNLLSSSYPFPGNTISLSLPVQQSYLNLKPSPIHGSSLSTSSSNQHVSCQNLFLTVRLRHSPRRILRSPEIHLVSSVPNSNMIHDSTGSTYNSNSSKLNVHCNILYSHFLKKDNNVLQIVVQRRKNYKNKTMVLGYKTLAYCNIDLALILQRRVENRYFDLYSSANYDDKPSSVLGRIHILSMSSTPLDKETNAFTSSSMAMSSRALGKRNLSIGSSNVCPPSKLKDDSTKALPVFHSSKTSDSRPVSSVLPNMLSMEQEENSCDNVDNGEDSCLEEALEGSCSLSVDKSNPSPHRESVFSKNKTMKMMRDGVRRQFKEKLAGLMKKMKIHESQEDDLDENTAALWAEIEKLETVSDLAEGSLGDEEDDDNSDNDSVSFSPESTPKPGLRPFYSTSRFSLERPKSFRDHQVIKQTLSPNYHIDRVDPFTHLDHDYRVHWNASNNATTDANTDSSVSLLPKPDYSSFESEEEDELDASTLSTGFLSSTVPSVSFHQNQTVQSISPPYSSLSPVESEVPPPIDRQLLDRTSSTYIPLSSQSQIPSELRGIPSVAPSHQPLQTLQNKLSSKFNHLLTSNPLHHAFTSSSGITEGGPNVDIIPQTQHQQALSQAPRFTSSIANSKMAQVARDRAAVFRDKLRHISNTSTSMDVSKKASQLVHGHSLSSTPFTSANVAESSQSMVTQSRNSAEVVLPSIQSPFSEPIISRKRSGSVQLEPSLSNPSSDFLNISSGSGALVTELHLIRATSHAKPCIHSVAALEPHRETVEQTSVVIEHEQRCQIPSPVIFLVHVASCPTGRAVCDALLKANRLTVAIRNGIDAKHFFTHLLSKQHKSRTNVPLRICLVIRDDSQINYVLQSYVELLGAKFPEQLGSQYRFYVAPLPLLHVADHLATNTLSIGKDSWFIQRIANMDSTYAKLFRTVPQNTHQPEICNESQSNTAISAIMTEFLSRLDSYIEKAVYVANVNIGECLVVGKFKSDDNKDEELSEVVLPFIGAVRSGDADQTLMHHMFPNVVCESVSCWCHDLSPEDNKVKTHVTSNTSVCLPASNLAPSTSSLAPGVDTTSPSTSTSIKSLEVTLDYWQDVSSSTMSPSIVSSASVAPNLNSGQVGNRVARSKVSSIKTTARAICILPEVWEDASLDPADLLSLAWCSKERKQKLMRIGRKGREQQESLRMEVVHRLTKVICSSKSQGSIMKISIDGVEYNNVKYFQVSPSWRTHVKYFPTAVFSVYSSQ